MITIPGYNFYENIAQKPNSIIFRAYKEKDKIPLIIKQRISGRQALTHEYEILKNLDIKGVIKPHRLETWEHKPVLIYEDPGGKTLKSLIHSAPGSAGGKHIFRFFEFAVSIAETLDKLHQCNIIHKDINPETILIDPIIWEPVFIDFSTATILPRENPKILHPHIPEGTLAYISPEQTGRMNRTLDYRTDYYSLGITFYEFLTGIIPFRNPNPLDMIYSHLAEQPVPPCEIIPEIPKSVSDMVLKLMAKTPEERYQSGPGLTADIEICRNRFQAKGKSKHFVPGAKDFSDKFQISQKLCGRDQETETLLEMFGQASLGKTGVVLVSGYAGIGKTSLVNQIYKPVVRRRGYFISGKCDRFHRNVPYNALVHAFQSLVRQILTEPESNLKYWKQILTENLGMYGQIITDVIPDTELITGPQAPVRELPSAEARNRFGRVFMNFIRVFCKKEHPLVIFMDDLQWADTATIDMIEGIVKHGDVKYLLLIGSYRDNEIGQVHPLLTALESIQQENHPVTQIRLGPLNPEHITQLVADTLGRDEQTAAPLADTLFRKTRGNPFFMTQFLTTLYQEKLLFFNPEQRRWEWDQEKIKNQDITDNVVDLLIQRLERMPRETQEIMHTAACIGNKFDAEMLARLARYESGSDIIRHLTPAMKEDLIVSVSEEQPYKHGHDPVMKNICKFQHDRIQQAAYALTGKEDKKTIHLRIGRVLIEKTGTDRPEEEIFDILNHLNFAVDLIREKSERLQLARLNLEAGKKARRSAAFEPAYNYLGTGISLLDSDTWETCYDLTLELFNECIEAARLGGYFTEMEQLSVTLVQNARKPTDQADAYKSRIQAYMAQNRLPEAISAAMKILDTLGEKLQIYTTGNEIMGEISRTISEIERKKIENLPRLPEMKDPSKLVVMRILSTIISATYIGAPEVFPLVVCKQVNLSMQYGSTPELAGAYTAMGLILCGTTKDIETGYRLGQLAMTVADRYDVKEIKGMIYHGISNYINPWKEHIRDTLKMSLEGYFNGVETGDFEFAAYNAFTYNVRSLLIGRNLDAVEQDTAKHGNAIAKLRQETALSFNRIFQQTVLNLLGKSENPCILVGDAYDEQVMFLVHQKVNDRLAIFFMYFCKLMLCYLFEAYPEALENAEHAEKGAQGAPGHASIATFYFYYSLALIAGFKNTRKSEQGAILEKIEEIRNKMKKWAEHAPANYLHKYFLIKAELTALTGNSDDAVAFYDRSAELARENAYLNEEALANELAAKYWLAREKKEFAGLFMQRALNCYIRWGARGKVRHLQEQYPELLARTDQGINKTFASDDITTPLPAGTGEQLDMRTMVKAAQAISGEIVLDRLITTLMQIVMENAGAERGVLILKSDRKFLVTAKWGTDQGEVLEKPRVLSETDEDVSYAIIMYVARTKKLLALNNVLDEDIFINDPYVQRWLPRSVLCMPLLYKSMLTGVFYLENRMISGIFTPERLETVNLLASQIAISIENARLYEDLKNAEEKYRGIFENAMEGIFQTTPDGRFISANPAMSVIFGYDSPEELMHKVTDISNQLYVSPTDREDLICILQENKPVSGFEIQFFRKDRSKIWVSLHARPVFDENSRLKIIEGIIEDITEKKHVTDILREREQYLRKENIRLKSGFKDRYKFGRIIGKSEAMQEVYELIVKAAASDANVIVYGESGTGKELASRAVHEISDRKKQSFVPVNCGAIPDNLVESEFFGYKKGAFTGANTDKPGYLDIADKGVLFLDELAELSLNMQVKLLRVLEDGGYTPVGGSEVKKPDVRIVAATNKDLLEQVKKGEMRNDFFFRIHIIPIYLPPLRERQEDIPLLIEHFINLYGHEKERPPFTGKILETILNYHWPGNIRELQNVLHRYFTLNRFDLLTDEPEEPRVLPVPETVFGAENLSYQAAMEMYEKKLIQTALEQNQWHREKAAASLGMSRRTFFRKLKKLDLIQHD
ncbi:MAG: AAA family ATPase [Desulfobacterales bacterium]|nr:AAA family ATPase [Desulfobacterales bacterium]